jgi:ABC-2 type transport system permease protein
MWLQPVANNLPLSYFNISARIITTEGGTLIQTWPYMAGLMTWGILMYILAAKTFRWQ